jgi:hypothetical protein
MIQGETKTSPQMASRRDAVSLTRPDPVERAALVRSTVVLDIALEPALRL